MAFMNMNDKTLGLVFIIFGAIILASSTWPVTLYIVSTIFSLVIINHGLRLRGMPSLFVLFQQWLDKIGF